MQQWLPHANGDVLAFLNRTWGRGTPHPIDFYVAKIDYLARFFILIWAGLVPTLALFNYRLGNPGNRSPLPELGLTLLYAFLFYLFLIIFGSEESWYPIEKMLNYTGKPPFQHRVLLLFPAQALLYVAPSLSYLHAYIFSQMVAVFVALWAVKRFSALFIREDLAFVGQFLALLMWAPTIKYYTFYDIAIIAVYALALRFLLTHRLLPYLLVFTIGTLNHELTLFLVGISALVLFGQIKLPKLAGFLALQLACYGAVRVLMFTLLPAKSAWEGGKPALNINLFLHQPTQIVSSLGPLLLWYAIAAFGLRSAPVALRWCVALLPCLAVMTFFVGQLNESRQFDAFIPVGVALMVCAIRAKSTATAPQSQLNPTGYTLAGA
ncbi:hypothetical protein GTP45_00535 [Pseudoduganella sp. FT55W]|uniref:EpsG family protein n=1 Tax=Duganella rivi TaxID=2666083 RepID=A0A7X4K9W6_9BURK|nr:hypothetical protein [Duganella rivi]MYM65317.1 hypothetical protein [Duganella rivi]